MSMIKKSITVTDKQNDWIRAQIVSGHYGNDEELENIARNGKQLGNQ